MLKLIIPLIVCGLVPEFSAHDRPVVGVLVQEISNIFEMIYPRRFTSFVASSYVKWVESGGARVVPIWVGKDRAYYQQLLSKINGVLLPGGSVDKHAIGGYVEAAEHILNIAIDINIRQEVFPVFGIGLGMDVMLYLSNDKKDETSDCVLDNLIAPLILSDKDSKKTALYNSSSEHIKKLMTEHDVAVLNAKKCYKKENFSPYTNKKWIPFSYNLDRSGYQIISSVEHDLLPFYGTLFHPEKVAFEWAENSSFPHSLATLEVSQFLGNYFVNEARKNEHTFSNKEELYDKLIQNYPPVFTEKDGSSYFQAYLFGKTDNEM